MLGLDVFYWTCWLKLLKEILRTLAVLVAASFVVLHAFILFIS